MNTVQLSTTPAGEHVFVRPIHDGGAEPVETIVIDGREINVGDTFVPTKYWCGRNHRLLEKQWEYKLADGTWTHRVPKRGEEVLDQRLVPAPVVPKAQLDVARLKMALDKEDHNELGAALAAFTDEVPSKKDERIAVGKAILAAR